MRALVVPLVLVAACGAPQSPQHGPEAASTASGAATAAPVAAATATPPASTTAAPSDGTTTSTSAPPAASSAAPGDTGGAKARPKPTEITARHVLIQWMGAQSASSSVVRTREQAEKVAADVLRRAKAGADFARLAVEFSDEPNAAARGGSLGRFGHGQMVKQFEDAAFALAPGEISGIVESPFGFHIIQRTE